MLPRVTAIRPRLHEEPFDDPNYLFEIKYDGFRGLLMTDSGMSRFVSRNNRTFARRRFATFARELAREFRLTSAIFDGELVAEDETRRPIFAAIMRDEGHLRYVVFDVLYLNGRDLRSVPLMQRRALLTEIIKESSKLALPIAAQERGKTLYELALKHDLEGVIAKRLGDPYQPWVRWYKIKNPDYSQAQAHRKYFAHASPDSP